jgi:hypothetical protein
MKRVSIFTSLILLAAFAVESMLVAHGQAPLRTASTQSNPPALPADLLQRLRSAPRPGPLTAKRGIPPSYRVTANGSKQLASNIGLLPTAAGMLPRQVPVRLDANRKATGIRPELLVQLTGRAALISVVSPEEAVPTGKIVVFGNYYDDIVSMTVATVVPIGIRTPRAWASIILAHPQLAAHRTPELGDWVEWTIPANMAPGRYWVSIENKNALGSNPGYFTIKAPYPTRAYVVAMMDHLNLPSDYDTSTFGISDGTGPGELTFNFGASTGNAGLEIARQSITYGENGSNGFMVNGSLNLLPGEIQAPMFALPYDRMGDALMFTFVGQEFDSATDSAAWGIAGGIIGSAAGAFYSGAGGVVSGYQLGSDIARQAAQKLGDSGNDSLGVYTNSFLRGDDFGASLPGYPSVEAFDNNVNTSGRDIRISYRVLPIDAPLVRRVTVRINSVDTSRVKLPVINGFNGIPLIYKPKFYVLARAFDGPRGANFPATEKKNLVPVDRVSATAKLDDAGNPLFDNPNSHHMPFVYVELSLWFVAPVPGQNNRMVGRTYSRMLWPWDLIRPDQTHVEIPVVETVAAHAGAGTESGGTFAVNYTITIDR